ncbi:protein RIC-3b [Engraulis encrasicolus]|uniref:protein RIC-3b n=1 Tax=Engraulis encrasicolus TaxID=184585 RepID=UPI002FD18841
MPMSTFQKVTLVSCLVLCVALLLPKMLLSQSKKGNTQAEGGPGHYPPMVRRQVAPEAKKGGGGAHFNRAHNPEAIARAKGGGGTGVAPGGKSSFAGQIVPIYGFGILLYIMYILFKITSKGTSKPPESRFTAIRSENMKRKITDFELAQLQEKLKETEEVMERIVSKSSPERRIKGVSADQEETLLFQLKEITQMMNKGSLLEGITPEQTVNSPCPQHWEDDVEETDPRPASGCCQHGHSHGYQHRQDEWLERPEDEGMADTIDRDDVETLGTVGDIWPGETEEVINGISDNSLIRADTGDHECVLDDDEDKLDQSTDNEEGDVVGEHVLEFEKAAMVEEHISEDDPVSELQYVTKDEENCSVWTSVLSECESASAQLRRRSKKPPKRIN